MSIKDFSSLDKTLNNLFDNKIPIIGIIDSGLDRRFVKEYNLSIEKAAIFNINEQENDLEIIEYDNDDIKKWCEGEINHLNDYSGHGTAVTSIIWNNYSESKFAIAKINNINDGNSSFLLIEALKWMIESTDAEVINISMGTVDYKIKEELFDITLKALERGIIIFVAASGIVSYPALLSTVITVGNKGLLNSNISNEILNNLDIIIDKEKTKIWENGIWKEVDLSTSYACAMVQFHIFNKILKCINFNIRFSFLSPDKAFVFCKKELTSKFPDVEILFLSIVEIRFINIIKLYQINFVSQLSQIKMIYNYKFCKPYERDGYYYFYFNVNPKYFYIVFLISKPEGRIIAKSQIKRMEW